MARVRRLRRMLVGLLVVLSCLSVTASTVALWTRRTVSNSDRWAELAGDVIKHPDVQEGLSDRLSTLLVGALDVEERVGAALSQAERLPPAQASLIAGAVSDSFRTRVENRILQMLRNPDVQKLWVDINRRAHEAIRRLIRGETNRPGISVGEGTVTLNLVPLINRALTATEDLLTELFDRPIDVPSAEEIEGSETAEQATALIEDRLDVDLPDDYGQLVVLRSDTLAAAQDGVRIINTFVLLLVILTVLLIIASLVLSLSRRRTLIQLAIGVLAGALVTRLIVKAVQQRVVDMSSEGARGAVGDVLATVFNGLLDLTVFLIVGAAIVGIGVHLAGHPRWLERLQARFNMDQGGAAPSGTATWISAHLDGLRFLGVVVALVALFIVDLSWASVLITVVLLGLYELGLTYMNRRAPAPAPTNT